MRTSSRLPARPGTGPAAVCSCSLSCAALPLRLVIAAGSTLRAAGTVLDAVFRDGRDVSDPAVIAVLARELGVEDPQAALADPAIKQRLTDLGCRIAGGSPADFAGFIAKETDKWANVIKFAGITAD